MLVARTLFFFFFYLVSGLFLSSSAFQRETLTQLVFIRHLGYSTAVGCDAECNYLQEPGSQLRATVPASAALTHWAARAIEPLQRLCRPFLFLALQGIKSLLLA